MGCFLQRVSILNNKIKYNCVFGGGGIRGLCYVGAIKALDELDIELNSIAGSSVGAVFAALYSVGYNADEIKELFFSFNYNMFRDINITMFSSDISFSKGEIFLEWLKEKIEQKFYGDCYKKGESNPVKFKDITKDLYVHTIDLNTNTPFIFSKETTPDEEIAFAVRASASLPGLMKPVNYGDAILVDGDLIKSWPAWKVYNSLDTSDSRLLEFRLEGSRKSNDIKSPLDYLNSIINTIWFLSTENVFNTYSQNDRYDYIVIDTKEIILFDFNLDKSTKNELIELGYKTTKHYLSNTLVEKKKKILKIYKNIIADLLFFKKTIKDDSPDKCISVMDRILSEILETEEYIDKFFVQQLKNLKDSLLLNIKKIFIFPKKLNNEKQILLRIDFVINLVEERISDIENYINFFFKNC